MDLHPENSISAIFSEPEQRAFPQSPPGTTHRGESLLANGVCLKISSSLLPETALAELRTVLDGWKIPRRSDGYPFVIQEDSALEQEEFHLCADAERCRLTASDREGFRRGLYYLASHLEHAGGPLIRHGTVCCRQKIRNRISRCFFGPTHRPPHDVDELMNAVEYYPESYLNILAREGINVLWITVRFLEVTHSFIQTPDPNMEQRLEKLRRTVRKCALYGIRIFVFCIEPEGFIGQSPLADSHPELEGISNWGYGMRGFCPSTDTAQRHLYEQVKNLFSAVPGLGGIIDITYGEHISSCFFNPVPGFSCPRCSELTPMQILRRVLDPMVRGMKESAPEAELISWFYQSSEAKEVPEWIYASAAGITSGVVNLYNFESGITARQQGESRRGGDYWLSQPGPSHRFKKLARLLEKKKIPCGAKLQISNGHELATVPVIPVPGLLYRKYKFICSHHVNTIMYSWFFGCSPGLMNRAALMLSSWDFKHTEAEFLTEFARAEWGKDAAAVAHAWKCFSDGFALYPLDTTVQYSGPFHHGIVWPLYAEVEFKDIYVTWKPLPVSGDSIGKFLGGFSLESFERQTASMSRIFNQGLKYLLPLKEKYEKDSRHLREIRYAEAVGLLLTSGWHIARFYLLRKALYNGRHSALNEMKKIAREEMIASARMAELCCLEPLIGYHPEAETWKITPRLLADRIEQLRELTEKKIPELQKRLANGGAPEFPPEWPENICVPDGSLHRQASFSWKMKKGRGSLKISVVCSYPPGTPDSVGDRLYILFCDELYSSFPLITGVTYSGPLKMPNVYVPSTGIRVHAGKTRWSVDVVFPLDRLPAKPTFNIFRQYFSNGKNVVDSWCRNPGEMSLGAGEKIMRSAAMGRLLLEECKEKQQYSK